jgi:ABC-type multidrug transport system fused ATPase/permease subunit
VLTIAHRVKTIMDSTKILTLRDGMVLEYDTPRELLKNPESGFCKIVEQEQRGKHQ